MALDPSAREANIRDSIKRYFVQNLYDTEGLEVMFDKSLSTPNLVGKAVDRWVVVNFGSMELGSSSELYLNIFVCSRQDAEGFKLAQTRDKVVGCLSDTTKTDSMARIPFYKSSATEAWTLIGALIVPEVVEGPQFEAEDMTKYKQLTVRLFWSAKV
ncbi:unnamed protein product [marine sediment metagenome]|uniref:Uncharacterized protein n=1 Tax=marine sediment metagenome TaxID=412755 RepID=X0SK85_9ZZZZ